LFAEFFLALNASPCTLAYAWWIIAQFIEAMSRFVFGDNSCPWALGGKVNIVSVFLDGYEEFLIGISSGGTPAHQYVHAEGDVGSHVNEFVNIFFVPVETVILSLRKRLCFEQSLPAISLVLG
jgi:hypothetical protein